MLTSSGKKEKIMFKERVLVVAVRHLDFVAKQTGEQVKGDKVFYVRNCYDNEMNYGWLGMKKLDDFFVRPESYVKLPDFQQLPCECDLVYQPAGRQNTLSAVEIVKGEK